MEMVPLFAIFNDVLCASFGVEPLAASHFSIDRGKETTHCRTIQIGHHVHTVRQILEGRKGTTTFEIDQDKVENRRVIGQRHANDHRHEQLRFTRTSATSDHAVDAIAVGAEVHGSHPVAWQCPNRDTQPFSFFAADTLLPVLCSLFLKTLQKTVVEIPAIFSSYQLFEEDRLGQ